MADVIVVGAGITGLSCAWWLRQLGHTPKVIETGSRAGGVVRTESINGYLVEWGPNSLLPTAETFLLLDQTGLNNDLIEAPRAPRFIYINKRLRKVPFGPLTGRGLLRMLAEPFVSSKSIPDESVRNFFVRRVGQEAHDRLVAPFVTGIYAGDTRLMSAAAAFPRLVEMEKNFGSLTMAMLRSRRTKNSRPGRLSTFRAGMESLPQKLSDGLDIDFNADKTRVGRDAKAVVLTVPAYSAVEILEQHEPALARLLERVEYAPMIVAATSLPESAFDRPLKGFGFLVPRSEGMHVLGTIFSSSLFPGRAPGGRVLLTSFVGGAHEPEAMDWPDGRIWDIVSQELKQVLQVRITPEPVILFRHRRAIPQFSIGHERWVARLRAELKKCPGLFITGNFLDGVSVPACLETGRQTALEVAGHLGKV